MNANTLLKLCVALLLLIGCTTPKALNRRSERLKKQMNKKGVLIPVDTIQKTDTLETVITRNDTVFVTKEIIKTLEPKTEYITNRVVKWKERIKYKTVKVENRAMVDSLRQELKLEKQKTKQTRIEKRRSKWYIWLLIGIVIGFLLPYAYKTIGYAIRKKL